MADKSTDPLTHDELLNTLVSSTPDGYLLIGKPGAYQVIGHVDPRYAYVLRAGPSLYQTLNTVQLLLQTFLETADLIREDHIAERLQRITSSVDLALRFCRNEA